MILKRDLLDGIDALTQQVILQGERICELEARVKKLEPKKGRPGRPRKNAKKD